MRLFNYRGKRIKASDKSLVFRFSGGLLLLIFSVVIFIFNRKQILSIFHAWKTNGLIQGHPLSLSPYAVVIIIVSLFICVLCALLYYHFFYNHIKKLIHRQKLAKMIIQNGWYEKESIQNQGYFKDLSNSRTKDKITHFPRMYYQLKNGLIHITVEITMSKYQDQLLNLEKKLESGLFCELVDKVLYDSFVEYTLFYDMRANRIEISEVKALNGSLQLMKNVFWEFDVLPHMLVAGGTGGGKTYFLLTIIESLLSTNADLIILDPKNADLSDLATVMPDVYYRKEDIISNIEKFHNDMMARSEKMKEMEGYKTGKNYAYLNLPACFLIFDEYVAFMEMLSTKENAVVLGNLKRIVMLGRQAGYFLILACQRPDAKYFSDGIRDQFHFRVALGRMSDLGYKMMFGESKKDFFQKRIKGRGYVDTGIGVISEFYTPVVPKDHNFLLEIGKLAEHRQDGQSAGEAKADCPD